MVSSGPEGRMGFVPASEGGVEHKSCARWNTTAFTYLSHSAVVIAGESALALRTREKGGDESDPPKNRGVM